MRIFTLQKLLLKNNKHDEFNEVKKIYIANKITKKKEMDI